MNPILEAIKLHLLQGSAQQTPEQTLAQFAKIRAARDAIGADNPGQRELSYEDRRLSTRGLASEGNPIALAMPVLAAGEQGLKGLASLAGLRYGRSGFAPGGIRSTLQGLGQGIADRLR